MGCIRSKPIRDQVEEEDRCVFEGPEESYSSEMKPDLLIQKVSFESSTDAGCLKTKLEFEEDSAIAANELGTEPKGPNVPSVSTEDRSSDDGEDDLTVEMQLLRVSLKNGDAIESTQTQSESANGIAIWVLEVVLGNIDYDSLNNGGKDEELIAYDDEDTDLSDFEYFQFQRTNRFRMTIRRPRKSPPSPLKVCTESNRLEQKASTELEQNKLPPSGEMDISGASTSSRDIDSEKETSISKDIILLPENTIDDASPSNRDIDSEKEKSVSKDIKLFPENTIDDAPTSTRDIDSEKEKSISNDIKLFPENTIDDASTSIRDIDSEKEKSISKDIKLFPENTIDDASTSARDIDSEKEKSLSKDIKLFLENIIASATMTTEVLLSVPECTVQSTSDNDLDLTMIENGGGLVNGHDDFNEPDNVTLNDITSEPSQPDDAETRIDEERENRRLQWLARRKSTRPSVYVQPDMSLDEKPREIDIDSVMARKKFPWMR